MEKAFDHLGLYEAGRQMLFERLASAASKSVVVELGPRRPDDPQIGRQQPVRV